MIWFVWIIGWKVSPFIIRAVVETSSSALDLQVQDFCHSSSPPVFGSFDEDVVLLLIFFRRPGLLFFLLLLLFALIMNDHCFFSHFFFFFLFGKQPANLNWVHTLCKQQCKHINTHISGEKALQCSDRWRREGIPFLFHYWSYWPR